MYRQSIIRSFCATTPASTRYFSAGARFQKSPVETVKDAAKAVDRTISDAAVKGIETGGTCLEPLLSSSSFSSFSPLAHPMNIIQRYNGLQWTWS